VSRSQLESLANRCESIFGSIVPVQFEVGSSGFELIQISGNDAGGAGITIAESAGGYVIFAETLEVETEESEVLTHQVFVIGAISMVSAYGVRRFPWNGFGELSVSGSSVNVAITVPRRRLSRELRGWEPWESSLVAHTPFLRNLEDSVPVIQSVRMIARGGPI